MKLGFSIEIDQELVQLPGGITTGSEREDLKEIIIGLPFDSADLAVEEEVFHPNVHFIRLTKPVLPTNLWISMLKCLLYPNC